MSGRTGSILDAAANFAFVIAAVSMVSFSAIRTFRTEPLPAAQEGLSVGASLLPDEHSTAWQSRTVLVVVSSTCRFCTASMDFYRRLSQVLAEGAGPALLFVSAEPIETLDGYLKQHGLTKAATGPLPAGYTGGGTPTLLLLDADGRIAHSWLGQLSAEQEEQVLDAVLGGGRDRW